MLMIYKKQQDINEFLETKDVNEILETRRR